ncbi:ester cyclase [Ponticoccus sp. SC2-23]|uniref:nuclear transport factor 2 family protein n=1 Tax=Alexandriicola marinus TaxID=2081710 RepID=UPI000FD9FDAA|nr:ester cyclase [Alexandriicola marinus]MBM1221091.1 ester cyclase [Ponticoccus sp. SC6-9]MBM1225661.1 ester cyclase [Ponticoccus sp. SC6-15]MBM1227813.1 ester cyclase [Ponticoccus sp. SC6-38]MBM1234549.1 ester cyclase [Ponticoccus sp. SC6-45]MBM1238315.1 ester cyclase [Ponticoccus sp. SC6-49]MBM1243584.1 ester cyclase [Ponticoccus sp. SC2-64]MBM1248073.1 ester cyclase [Ponticoccus sp. SC6-42]MBM1252715.1 ester cyclase [Ponticoccus sp. SC6-33]MBM1256324.1 ester cyclase [Ponticoccus sp. SC
MKNFSNKWKDFPDYILGVTREIWEDRGVATLNHYYSDDIPVRSPMGLQRGNKAVIAATMATINEFPDRQLYGEDVIWSNDPDYGLLSSHRLITTATHTRDGQFGPATGKRWTVRVIADCAAKDDTIYDEWLIRDYGGIVRQMGHDPREFTAALIEREGGPEKATPVFLPENDVDGGYRSRGNDNEWGARYSALLNAIMETDFNAVFREYDRAVIGEYAGGRQTLGRDEALEFWVGLRSSFPSARFEIHHQIGMDAGMLSPRASVRWSLDGTHDGWGSFGRPTGKRVHVMGLCHAEFGPWGLRREFALYDEIAIWKQILG